jgi:hypothetical protein
VAENKRGGRRTLLILALLFLAPLAGAFWLYYGASWRPLGTTNRGELIVPARALPDAPAMHGADGKPILHAKWSLVVVTEDGCGPECQRGLEYAERTLASLGRLQVRTQSVLISDGPCCSSNETVMASRALLKVDASAATAVIAAFPGPERASAIFVVDPLGNLMMRYDSALDPKGLREDLTHLLDLSRIG